MRCHKHPPSGSCAVLFRKVNSCFWQLLCTHTQESIAYFLVCLQSSMKHVICLLPYIIFPVPNQIVLTV